MTTYNVIAQKLCDSNYGNTTLLYWVVRSLDGRRTSHTTQIPNTDSVMNYDRQETRDITKRIRNFGQLSSGSL